MYIETDRITGKCGCVEIMGAFAVPVDMAGALVDEKTHSIR